jgi:hypothetical protein
MPPPVNANRRDDADEAPVAQDGPETERAVVNHVVQLTAQTATFS